MVNVMMVAMSVMVAMGMSVSMMMTVTIMVTVIIMMPMSMMMGFTITMMAMMNTMSNMAIANNHMATVAAAVAAVTMAMTTTDDGAMVAKSSLVFRFFLAFIGVALSAVVVSIQRIVGVVMTVMRPSFVSHVTMWPVTLPGSMFISVRCFALVTASIWFVTSFRTLVILPLAIFGITYNLVCDAAVH
jgi:hypothetical protein